MSKTRIWFISLALSVVAAILLTLFVAFVFVSAAHAQAPSDNMARMSASPSGGEKPLDVTVTIQADSQLLCTAFMIDWGDGSPVESYTPSSFSENCYGGKFVRKFTHTYKKVGVFVIKAKAGDLPLDKLTTMKLYISVIDADTATSTTHSSQDDEPCFINPKKGFEPLTAGAYIPLGGEKCDGKYKYFVDWGDGWRTPTSTCSNKAQHYDTFYHKYKVATSSEYTAKLLSFYNSEKISEETCKVTLYKKPTIEITRPNWPATAVIGKPLNIEWKVTNEPPALNNINPKVRLIFITKDNKAGFIKDFDMATSTYKWVPTAETCETGVCQSAIAPGYYKLGASIIYDVCNGDPFCGKQIPTVAATTTADYIKVSTTGEPEDSWLFSVKDRLFAYPQTSPSPALVNFTAVLNSDASCDGGIYTIDFGDQDTTSLSYPKGKCAAFASSFTHTYLKPGLYNVVLNKNGINTARMLIRVTEPKKVSFGIKNLASVFDAVKRLISLWFH